MLKTGLQLICIFLVIAQVLSCWITYLPPSLFGYSSLVGFAFIPLVLINFILFLFFILKKNKFLFVILGGFLLCLQSLRASFGTHFLTSDKPAGTKLMTFNCKNFDLYNWTGNAETHADIFAMLTQESPDILCLQEFYTDDDTYKNKEEVGQKLNLKNVDFFPVITNKHKGANNSLRSLQWGLAVFSKYPIEAVEQVKFEKNSSNGLCISDVTIGNKKVRIFNIHLQSIHFGYDDYNTLEEVTENQQTDWNKIVSILGKIKLASIKRQEQANLIHTKIESSPYPVLLCGDLNDIPLSYTYHRLANLLADAFVQKGVGFGNTFVNPYTYFRIDQVMGSKEIHFTSHEVIHKYLSDHYAVKSNFVF